MVLKKQYLKSIVVMLLFLVASITYAQDDCATATTVTDLTGGSCATSSVGSTNTIGSGGCEEGTLDTWFSFVAQGPSATINVSSTAGGFRPEYVVASTDDGTCAGAFTVENCIDQNGN